MKHIGNLWNLLKQEISLWKYEKQELAKGICYIVMIAWLFFDQIAFAILLIPYLFVFMKQNHGFSLQSISFCKSVFSVLGLNSGPHAAFSYHISLSSNL